MTEKINADDERFGDDNYYFWIGHEGDPEFLNKEEFEQRQKDWKGHRPQDFEGEGF